MFYIFFYFYVQQVCQGHAIAPFHGKCQNLQMFPTHFPASSYRFRDNKIIFYLQKVYQGHRWQFSQLRLSMANINLQMSPVQFFANPCRFRDITILNLLPSKSMSRSQSKIFAITSFDGKCTIYQRHFFTFLIFAKV